MTMTKFVAQAVDSAFGDPRLGEFSKIDAKDGISVRRYYSGSQDREREVLVYRDKWWSKSGGRLYVELFCLVGEVQRALGGCDQSWLSPDYARPIVVFQYRSSRDARSTERTIASKQDAIELGGWLVEFLAGEGLRWFRRFDSNEDITAYMQRQGMHVQLARWHAHLGDGAAALDALRAFLRGFPREIEADLAAMESLGLIGEVERKTLLRASMQKREDYEMEVERWCASRDS